MSNKAANILLIEDNPADIEITRQALQGVTIPHQLHVICDGEKALQFFRQQGEYAGVPAPDLTLLDLNLPGMDGRTLLGELKTDQRLAELPVVVLSSSSAPSDIRDSYGLNANSYLTKPRGFLEFTELLQSACHYWLEVVNK